MTYPSTRRFIILRLTELLRHFENDNFSDRQVMGNVHKAVSDTLYDARMNNMIFDYRVQVRFKDFTDEAAGYEVDIKVWPTKHQQADNFFLYVRPSNEPTMADHIAAYDRAMGIL